MLGPFWQRKRFLMDPCSVVPVEEPAAEGALVGSSARAVVALELAAVQSERWKCVPMLCWLKFYPEVWEAKRARKLLTGAIARTAHPAMQRSRL